MADLARSLIEAHATLCDFHGDRIEVFALMGQVFLGVQDRCEREGIKAFADLSPDLARSLIVALTEAIEAAES